MAHVEQRDGRGSNKRRLLWVILLVGIATLGIFRWHTYRRLMQRIEALRTQGYPTSAAELDDWYRESAPNDVGQGWDAYADAFWDYVEWSDQETENLPGYGRDIKFQRGQSWEPVHLQKAEAFLTENKVCLDLLHKAAERGPILAPFDLSEGRDLWLREVREVRQCAKLLQLASRTAARHKDGEGSIMAIRTMLSLADTMAAPLLMCHMVRMSIEREALQTLEDLVSLRALSEMQLQELQTAIAPAGYVHAYQNGLIGERAINLDLLLASAEDIETGMKMSANDEGPKFWSEIIFLRKLLGLHDQDTLSYINGIQACMQAAALPSNTALPRLIAIEEALREELGRVAQSMILKRSEFYRIFVRGMADSRCASTALSVERFRLARGHLPDRLDDLVPGFLQSVPLDPFDGQGLRYHRREAGYVVYSVGLDLADNQGREGKNRRSSNAAIGWDETFTVER